MTTNEATRELRLTINGQPWSGFVKARQSLADFLRETLSLTGTHLGCEHGVCGACTVIVDGSPRRACLALAAAMEGREIVTIEGLKGPLIDELRAAFSRSHALQCGFCTPGMLITAYDLVCRGITLEQDVRTALSGNLCRCTGYQGIVKAVQQTALAVQGNKVRN